MRLPCKTIIDIYIYVFKSISSSSKVFPIIIVSGILDVIINLFVLKVLHQESRLSFKQKNTSLLCWNVRNLHQFLVHLDLRGQVRTIFRLIDPTCSDCTVETDDIWKSRIGTLRKG